MRRLRGARRRLQSAWAGLSDPFARLSYAQEGEDLILERIFETRSQGFYVDVGAHHPKRFSNTYLFYLKGWSGVNIDAMPGSMQPFQRLRPRDRNIEAAIAAEAAPITFYIYNEPALNSTVPPEERNLDSAKYHVVRKETVMTRRLAEVLTETVPSQQSIDFLTVDVEGIDLHVLQSNDWQRFRPAYVLAEELRRPSDATGPGCLAAFMRGQGYSVYCRTMNTIFFRDDLSEARLR